MKNNCGPLCGPFRQIPAPVAHCDKCGQEICARCRTFEPQWGETYHNRVQCKAMQRIFIDRLVCDRCLGGMSYYDHLPEGVCQTCDMCSDPDCVEMVESGGLPLPSDTLRVCKTRGCDRRICAEGHWYEMDGECPYDDWSESGQTCFDCVRAYYEFARETPW